VTDGQTDILRQHSPLYAYVSHIVKSWRYINSIIIMHSIAR